MVEMRGKLDRKVAENREMWMEGSLDVELVIID